MRYKMKKKCGFTTIFMYYRNQRYLENVDKSTIFVSYCKEAFLFLRE